MTDRYKPLREAISVRSWPVGDSFQRNMGLVEDLLKERNALRDALTELYAAVKGECPSLLDEDRGGSARLDMAVSAALADGEDDVCL